MKCPYLSSASKKECVKMSAENMDPELSDFDLRHFCDGNPVYCYYFRLPALRKTNPPSKPEAPSANMAEKTLITTVLEKDDLLKMERHQWKEQCPSDEQQKEYFR